MQQYTHSGFNQFIGNYLQSLNGEMVLILCYFTEFGTFRVHCVKVVDKAITMDNLQLLSSKRLQRDRATPADINIL